MSNSTVSLYNLLNTEYPGQVYNGQLGQSVPIQSTNGTILLTTISSASTKNKDNAKRDQIVYNIQVLGLLQKTVDALAEEVRNLVEPFTDEYVYLMEFDGTITNYDYEGEVYQKILTFNCWPNTDGLNVPTGYLEYYAYFNFLTGAITILNQTAPNFMPIDWDYTNSNNDYWSFEATHTTTQSAIEVFWLTPNGQTMQMQWTSTIGANNVLLELTSTEVLQETQILIRKRKDVSGTFNYTV